MIALAGIIGSAQAQSPYHSTPSNAIRKYGTSNLRHGSQVLALTFSPDGSRLASLTETGIFVWSRDTGSLLAYAPVDDKNSALVAHPEGWRHALRFAPDGKSVYAAFATLNSKNKPCIELQLVAEKQPPVKREILHPKARAVAISPDCKTLAVLANDDDALALITLPDGTDARYLRKSPAKTMEYSHRGGYLLLAYPREAVWVLDPSTNTYEYAAEPYTLGTGLSLAPDGMYAALFATNRCEIWNIKSRKKEWETTDNQNTIKLADFSPTSEYVIVCNGRKVHLHRTKNGALVKTFERHGNDVTHVAFSPKADCFATGDASGLVCLWPLKPHVDVPNLPGHYAAVQAAAFAPNGTMLASVGMDNRLIFWDPSGAKQLAAIPLPWPYEDSEIKGLGDPFRFDYFPRRSSYAIGFSPDGALLAVHTPTGALYVLDATRTAGQILRLSPDNHGDMSLPPVCSFLPAVGTERRLTSLGQGVISRWNVEKRKKTNDITIHIPETRYEFPVFVYSADGRFLAGSGEDTLPIRIWNAETGKEYATCDDGKMGSCFHNLTIARDARLLAAVFEHEITLWQPTSSRPFGQMNFPPQTSVSSRRPPVAISSDGRLLAATGLRYSNRDEPTDFHYLTMVWEIDTEAVLLRYCHQTPLDTCLLFSPKNDELIAGSADGTLVAWPIPMPSRPSSISSPVQGRSDCNRLWNDLGSSDAMIGRYAMIALAEADTAAVYYLASRLRPLPRTPSTQLQQWIEQLASDDDEEREQATHELERVGKDALPFLEKSLKAPRFAETRRRVQHLMDVIAISFPVRKHPTPVDVLRRLRAIQTLEWINTDAAKVLLGTLSRGASNARETDEARNTLNRLGIAHRAPLR